MENGARAITTKLKRWNMQDIKFIRLKKFLLWN